MRDVSHKISSLRVATARATIRVSPETIATMRAGQVPKGDPLPVARIAAIQAVKSTPLLIPYCHTVPIEHISVEFEVLDTEISVDVTVKSIYKTGVEMEAMAGAMVAVLNLYDVLKMIDDTMEVTSVALVSKKGGKSDHAMSVGWTFGVVIVSDGVSSGVRSDTSGVFLKSRLLAEGGEMVAEDLVPDDVGQIQSSVNAMVSQRLNLVVLTGGTGLGPRDVTPEAVRPLFDRELAGVSGHVQAYGQARVPSAMLSRLCSGVVGSTVVLALPGSEGAVREAMDALFPYLPHAFDIIAGSGHS